MKHGQTHKRRSSFDSCIWKYECYPTGLDDTYNDDDADDLSYFSDSTTQQTSSSTKGKNSSFYGR